MGATPEKRLAKLLIKAGLTLGLAESCTGGLIGHLITNLPGSSVFFDSGLIVYSNRAKTELLGVDPVVIEESGAVSARCAEAMAQGVIERRGVDVACAVTGIAGPTGGSADKPVGTVWFGLAALRAGLVRSEVICFKGDRESVKKSSADHAINALCEFVEGL